MAQQCGDRRGPAGGHDQPRAWRLKIIPSACGEKAVLKLMFGAMIRAAERWRAIRVSELERRQMRAVREELDHEYEVPNGLDAKASAPAPQNKISSTFRT